MPSGKTIPSRYILSIDNTIISSDDIEFNTSLDKVNIPIPVRIGYAFSGWDELIPENMPSNDIMFKALYNINEYTIHFENNDGTKILEESFNYASIINPPISPQKNGFQFSGWYLDQEYSELYTFSTMPAMDFILYGKICDNV